ncbi:tyrosine-type recombinase/integrase [Rhizobium sp. Root1204]|uniref:tyrosine-type recombinase/integrase n=1 Tax=Rhizobium sp. Root1204 TaxID=1736428 RepID=UPI0007140104|nr:tyrosine-type recombinase/integrase [Rhizobium sp. Root1204]KQV36326.1 hypothetical protein ASC96_28015 [Rhizobium sp. Root1204]
MASLNWISPRTRSPFLKSISHIPYIIGDDDEYIDGMNLYLQERCSGKIRLAKGIINNVGTYHRSHNAIRAIGYNLTNIVSWMYCIECHPDHGIIHWKNLARWHIEDLYREHMVRGFWTQEYWATSIQNSLDMRTTIRTRLREAHACYEWLATEGLVDWPKAVPPLYERQQVLLKSVDALATALPLSLRLSEQKLKYRRRIDPGDSTPLTPEQLRAIMRHVDKPVGYLVVLLYLWTGMRLDELIENTLVPGSLHNRSKKQRSLAKPQFPRHAYQLRYDPRNDEMIGVLPDEKASFESSEDMLPMRILGKGDKIRTVYIPSYLMRAIWRYYLLVRATPSGGNRSAMFINRRRGRLTARSVAYAIAEARRRAKETTGEDILITPHVLRHTFACISLEAIITGRARDKGQDPSKLTHKQIEDYGAEGVAVVQERLGHALPKDTARYLRRLRLGKAGLSYLQFFLDAMEETLGNEASF